MCEKIIPIHTFECQSTMHMGICAARVRLAVHILQSGVHKNASTFFSHSTCIICWSWYRHRCYIAADCVRACIHKCIQHSACFHRRSCVSVCVCVLLIRKTRLARRSTAACCLSVLVLHAPHSAVAVVVASVYGIGRTVLAQCECTCYATSRRRRRRHRRCE